VAESPAKDKNYNLITFLQESLQNVYQLDTYISDADGEGDDELKELLQQAKEHNQKGADEAKKLLSDRLQSEGG
jgi:hypothetical protein